MLAIWVVPKIGGTIFGGSPVIRILVFWGLYWGPPVLGNYHMIAGNWGDFVSSLG